MTIKILGSIDGMKPTGICQTDSKVLADEGCRCEVCLNELKAEREEKPLKVTQWEKL